jgi:HEAT repeat protein
MSISFVMALILFWLAMDNAHSSTLALYRVPYDFYHLEPREDAKNPVKVTADISELAWPYNDIASVLLAWSDKLTDRERARYCQTLIRAFLLIGPETAPAALAFLRDKEAEVRASAARALNEALFTQAPEDSPQANDDFEQVVARNKRLVPVFLDALKNDQEAVRMAVACALGLMELPQEMYVQPLMEALNDPSDRVKICAAWGLGWGEGGPAKRAVDAGNFPPPPGFVAYLEQKIATGEGPGEGVQRFSTIHLPMSQAERVEAVRGLLASPSHEEQQQGLLQWLLLGGDFRELLPLAMKAIDAVPTGFGFSVKKLPLQENDVIQLAGLLTSQNVAARRNIASALEEVPSLAKPATPMLLKALDDPDPWVRQYAIRTLSCSSSSEAVPIEKLVRFIKDQDATTAATAIAMLGKLGEKASAAGPAIMAALGSNSYEVQDAVAQALPSVLPASDEVVRALLGGLRNERTSSLGNQLIALGKSRQSAADLIVAWYRENLNAQKSALSAMTWEELPEVVAQLGEAYVPVAAEGLRSGTITARNATLAMLSRRGKSAAFAAPQVLELMTDKDTSVRAAAIVTLHAIDPESKRVRKAILTAMDDRENQVSAAAVHVAIDIPFTERETRLIGKKLINILRTRNTFEHYLPPPPPPMPDGGRREPAPTPFLVEAMVKFCVGQSQDLEKMWKDPDSKARSLAGEALTIMASNRGDTAGVFKKNLRQTPKSYEDVHRLLKMGASPQQSVQTLVETMKDSTDETQGETMIVLQLMQEKARPAIPALLAILKPEEPMPKLAQTPSSTRVTALMALKEIGWNDDEAVKAIISVARNAQEVSPFVIGALAGLVEKRRSHGM